MDTERPLRSLCKGVGRRGRESEGEDERERKQRARKRDSSERAGGRAGDRTNERNLEQEKSTRFQFVQAFRLFCCAP